MDVKGLMCPLPIIKIRKILTEMAVGEVVTVLTTDLSSNIDIRHFCNISGHKLVDAIEKDGMMTFIIRKGFLSG